MLDRSRETNNEQPIPQWSWLSPPYTEKPKEVFVQRKWLDHYGGAMRHGSLAGVIAKAALSPEYSLLDVVAAVKSAFGLAPQMWAELGAVDLVAQAPRLDVPVYFLMGRHDYTTPLPLVEDYCTVLEAPHKSIVWFGESAHMPNLEEPERFQRVLIDTVLAETRAYYEQAEETRAVSDRS